MSALAKLTTSRSKAVSSTALTTASAIPAADISGREVVGRDLLRRDQDAVFAGKWRLDAAVEEVSDVGILLRLGDAEIAEAGLREQVGEQVLHRFRQNDHGQREQLVVLRHADVVQILGNLAARNDVVEIFGAGQIGAVRSS